MPHILPYLYADHSPNSLGHVHVDMPHASPHSRIQTGQRLVDRMPVNPRMMAFESTQERFEVPLRPELRVPNSKCSHNDPNEDLCDFMETARARASKNDRRPPRPSKRSNFAPNKDRRIPSDLLEGADFQGAVPDHGFY